MSPKPFPSGRACQFRRLREQDLPVLRAWFGDAELSQRLSFPTDDWFAHVMKGAAACCWMARDAERIIGMIQVDRDEEGRGSLGFAVQPGLRGRGFGTTILSAFLSGPGRAYRVLEGAIEPDNAASLACCRRCGFAILPEPDADGFIRVVYRSPGIA